MCIRDSAKAVRPLIWFLGVSTNVVVRLFGGDPNVGREQVTEAEIRALVTGSQSLGAEERKIVDELFDAGERSLREVMVPRTEVAVSYTHLTLPTILRV